MKLKKFLSDGQWIGVFMMTFGLICEAASHADWGWLIFTSGSLYFTLATKIKYYRKMRKR